MKFILGKNRLIPFVQSLVGAGMLFFLFSCNNSNHDWKETYDLESEEPYGIDFFEKLLENFSPEGKLEVVEKRLDKVFTGDEVNSNYLLIGQAFLFKPDEIDALLQYVGKGNTAFFSTKSVPYDFLQAAIPEPCYYFGLEDYLYEPYYDTSVYLDLAHADLTDSIGHFLHFAQRNKPSLGYGWTYISPELFCDSVVSPVDLGYLEEEVNFLKIDYGDGTVYLHSTPMAFTNYHIRNERNLEYVEKLLTHLEPGDIFWDKSHHILESVSRRRNSRLSGQPDVKGFKETYLKYILSQPPLAWAWYILVGMALLYLIFRAKRRQRIIPVTEPITNTSYEFIDTIGRLHFQKGNPKQIILQKMKYLQSFIRTRYGLKDQEWDKKFIARLSQKSDVPEDLLERIKTMHHNVKTSRFSSDSILMEFHKMTEEFFRLKK